MKSLLALAFLGTASTTVSAFNDCGAGSVDNNVLSFNGGCNFVGMNQYIGSETFQDRTDFTSVILPDSVTHIFDNAFKDTQLDTVDLNNVEYIGPNAFEGTQLTDVVIPHTVSSIHDSAFKNTPLQTVDLGSVEFIGNEAFVGTQLTHVDFPTNTPTSIYSGAFYGITTLETVDLGSVVEIHAYAFYSSGLTQVVIPDTVTLISDQAFANTAITEVVIPNTVTTLQPDAFDADVVFLGCTDYADDNYNTHAAEGNPSAVVSCAAAAPAEPTGSCTSEGLSATEYQSLGCCEC